MTQDMNDITKCFLSFALILSSRFFFVQMKSLGEFASVFSYILLTFCGFLLPTVQIASQPTKVYTDPITMERHFAKYNKV